MNFQEEQNLINKVNGIDTKIDILTENLAKDIELKKKLEFAEKFIADHGMSDTYEKQKKTHNIK